MSIVPELLLSLQHDHRETIGIGFFEVLAHACHCLHRGASLGISDTECFCPTRSSDGIAVPSPQARVTIRISATQARMINGANLRIVRAMKGGWRRSVLMRPWLVLSSKERTSGRGPTGRSRALAGRRRTCWPPEPASQQGGDGWRHERTHDQRVEQQTEGNGGTDLSDDAQVADDHGPHSQSEHQARSSHDLAGTAHCSDDARVYARAYFLFHP